jgi:hypothetical protein
MGFMSSLVLYIFNFRFSMKKSLLLCASFKKILNVVFIINPRLRPFVGKNYSRYHPWQDII